MERPESVGAKGPISRTLFRLDSDALTCEPIPSDDRLDREVTSHGGPSEVVAIAPQEAVVSGRLRAEARGKFLFSGATKLRVCGVTYGTFRPDGRASEPGTLWEGRFRGLPRAHSFSLGSLDWSCRGVQLKCSNLLSARLSTIGSSTIRKIGWWITLSNLIIRALQIDYRPAAR